MHRGILLASVLVWSGVRCTHTYNRSAISLVLKTNYDSRVRPHEYTDMAEKISAWLTVISTDDINVGAEEFRIDFILWLSWQDPRLAHNNGRPIYVHHTDMHQIWLPDLYIVNSKRSLFEKTTVPNLQMAIYPSGMVIYDMRLTVHTHCHIDLRMFPWDIQRCPLIMQSYSQPHNVLSFEWSDDGQNGSTYIGALQRRPMAQYDMHDFSLSHTSVPYQQPDKKGNFSTLIATFAYKRLSKFYLLQIVAPSTIIVMLSWMSFFINPSEAPPRVFLGMSCLLAMSGTLNNVNSALPKVSYIKVLDVYLVSGYVFVALVLLEYATVLLLVERVKKAEIFRKEEKLDSVDHVMRIPMSRLLSRVRSCLHGNPFCMEIPVSAARTCDKIFAILTPSLYALFNIAFWVYVSKSLHWEDTTGEVIAAVMDEML